MRVNAYCVEGWVSTRGGLLHGCRFATRYEAAEQIDSYVLRIYNPFGWNQASRSTLHRSSRRTRTKLERSGCAKQELSLRAHEVPHAVLSLLAGTRKLTFKMGVGF